MEIWTCTSYDRLKGPFGGIFGLSSELSPGSQGDDFLGALDGQQLLVIEGSRCTISTLLLHGRVRCAAFVSSPQFKTFKWSKVHGEHVSAARRRRERRLRQFLPHERVSVAMAKAESNHHAAPRGQGVARAGGVEREENYEPRLLDPPLPPGGRCAALLSRR